MGLLNSIFGNNELNDKIQELENSNLEMQNILNRLPQGYSKHMMLLMLYLKIIMLNLQLP